MTVLIDTPLWPKHGTVWSHLVSDASIDELHAFARRMDVPPRAFDLDHYDVPISGTTTSSPQAPKRSHRANSSCA